MTNFKEKIGRFFIGLIVGIVIAMILISITVFTIKANQPIRIVPEAAKDAGCKVLLGAKYLNSDCMDANPNNIIFDGSLSNVPKFDANRDGSIDSKDTLQALCENYFGAKTDCECKYDCGCRIRCD